MAEISVIIPVYNVAEYLSKSLDSALMQTFGDIEVICVNDCSKDNSLAVLKEYTARDERVKIVDLKENKGVSNARNMGLKEACGKYVYFLDADDWIDADYLEKMHAAMVEKNVDIVLNTNAVCHRLGTQDSPFLPHYTLNFFENDYIRGSEAVCRLIWNVWANFYSKSFVDRIGAQFPVGYPYGEDLYFQLLTSLNTDKVYVIRNSQYHYLVRESGASKTFEDANMGHIEQLIRILNLMGEYVLNKSITDQNLPKLFVPEAYPPLSASKKDELILQIRDYIAKIEPIYQKTRGYYPPEEQEIFDGLLNDFENAKNIDFLHKIKMSRLKKYAAGFLRDHLKKKGLMK